MNNNYQLNIITMLNNYLANIVILKNKLYNFHFNITGESFSNIHNKTKEYYEYFNNLYDKVGERIKILEGFPIMSLTQIENISTIKDIDSKSYSKDEFYKTVMHDFNYLLNLSDQIGNYASDIKDLTTCDLMTNFTSFLEFELWQIRAMYK